MTRLHHVATTLWTPTAGTSPNTMAAPHPDLVLDAKADVGEAPVWCVRSQTLFWIDINAGELHQFDPSSGQDTRWNMGEPIGFVALTKTTDVVVALSSGLYSFNTATGTRSVLSDLNVGALGCRFNEGCIDSRGRVIVGSMRTNGDHVTDPAGTLYTFDGNKTSTALTGFHLINGMAMSHDGRTAYASDSLPSIRRIWAYDYDPDDGVWSNKREFFDTRHVDGRPDGATIDSDGCYWMAGISGWELVRITPKGDVDMRIPMPIEKPTNVMFGGPDFRTLYVTSLGGDIDQSKHQPHAGGLFSLEIKGVQGVAPRLAAL